MLAELDFVCVSKNTTDNNLDNNHQIFSKSIHHLIIR